MTSSTVAAPVRMCVGCRGRAEKSSLVRVAVVAGQVVVDQRQRLPGRGVYLHPDPDCLETAIRRRALVRGFGGAVRAGGLDPSSLRELLASRAAGLGDSDRAGYSD